MMRILAIALATLHVASSAATAQAPADLAGGLVVQLGADDVDTPARLGQSGRYLVHVLDTDAAAVARAQAQFRAKGFYGLVSAEHIADPGRLPYTENLVNLVIVASDEWQGAREEMIRVLAPGGAIVSPATRHQPLSTFRKPVPAGMDGWTHSRHAADGNPVSGDTLVGPPERIRWVAAATKEVEGVVTAGGRNFYGGILARDSFNGLRLWHRDLGRAKHNIGAFQLPGLARGRARPVAADDRVFAVEKGKLVSLDATTGKVLRTFPGLTNLRDLVHCDATVVACDNKSVTAFNVETGSAIWTCPAAGARNLAVANGIATFIQGGVENGPKLEAVALDLASGNVRWRRTDLPWLKRVYRTVLTGEYLCFEESSLNDHDKGNAMHMVLAKTGVSAWSKAYPPGMNHNRQARAMFLDDDVWILHGGRVDTADPKKKRSVALQTSALDPHTGETRRTYSAALAHCFPPVATPNWMFSGVMDLTNLKTGSLVVNPITKANCSREYGWVPANGLVYATPKHCTCWPILRGYVALAPEGASGEWQVARDESRLEKGPAFAKASAGTPAFGSQNPKSEIRNPKSVDWPLYRHDRWRSGSTTAPGPKSLTVKWTTSLAPSTPLPDGPILHDWRENEFVKGPVSAPTVAGDLVYVARPDAHEVVALDAVTGGVRWRFTANGRIDLPPAIHRGLCLFGTHAGYVYALRADTGQLAWRFRAAPNDERIVAYGQVESPWPVAGAVLVTDNVAYFAAGRQPLADGGIFVYAVEPATGRQLWVHQLDTIPQKGFYENSGLEFDPIDILHQEGDGITLSRWILTRDGKAANVDKWNAFARLDTGGGAVWVPRGCWTYGPRHQDRFRGEAPRRPLCVFRDHKVLSSFNGSTELFRRDFDIEGGEKFNSRWITGWEAAQKGSKGKNPFRTYRLAEKAKWRSDAFTPAEEKKPRIPGAQMSNELYVMAMGGDGRLFVGHKDGRLKAVSVADGSTLAETKAPPPAWDSLAIAGQRLYLVTRAGDLLCIGD
jgi:outer membrane protein assembly factor BamB